MCHITRKLQSTIATLKTPIEEGDPTDPHRRIAFAIEELEQLIDTIQDEEAYELHQLREAGGL